MTHDDALTLIDSYSYEPKRLLDWEAAISRLLPLETSEFQNVDEKTRVGYLQLIELRELIYGDWRF